MLRVVDKGARLEFYINKNKKCVWYKNGTVLTSTIVGIGMFGGGTGVDRSSVICV